MKSLIILLLSVLPVLSFSQNQEKQKESIDRYVELADLGKGSKQTNFKIAALKKVFHLISYQCQVKDGHITKIQRQFSHKDDSITQTFYLRNGGLVYAEEKIVSHYGNDSITWAGKFYFAGGKLIDQRTLGHGKSETDEWDPEAEMKTALFESKRDMTRYLKTKKGM